MKKFQKSLILAFEVIVQSPKHTFEIALFSILEHCSEKLDILKIELKTLDFEKILWKVGIFITKTTYKP